MPSIGLPSSVKQAVTETYFLGWGATAAAGSVAVSGIVADSNQGDKRTAGLNMLQSGGAIVGAALVAVGGLRSHLNVTEGAGWMGIGAGLIAGDAATGAARVAVAADF